VVGPADPRGAATGLAARTRCAEAGSRVGVAELTWTPAPEQGEQRIALTVFADGLARGNFQVSPILAAGASSYTWTNTNPGGVHRWMVLTHRGDVWTPSGSEMFTGETCVSDQAAPGG
jgi:hypothetical protein